jgi:hypothetical protein
LPTAALLLFFWGDACFTKGICGGSKLHVELIRNERATL